MCSGPFLPLERGGLYLVCSGPFLPLERGGLYQVCSGPFIPLERGGLYLLCSGPFIPLERRGLPRRLIPCSGPFRPLKRGGLSVQCASLLRWALERGGFPLTQCVVGPSSLLKEEAYTYCAVGSLFRQEVYPVCNGLFIPLERCLPSVEWAPYPS